MHVSEQTPWLRHSSSSWRTPTLCPGVNASSATRMSVSTKVFALTQLTNLNARVRSVSPGPRVVSTLMNVRTTCVTMERVWMGSETTRVFVTWDGQVDSVTWTRMNVRITHVRMEQ